MECAVGLTGEGRKLYRIRRTIMEMLKDRAYDVHDTEIHMSERDFINKFGENPTRRDFTILKSRRAVKDEIIVLFPEDEKLGMSTIKDYYSNLEKAKINRAVVVVKQSTSPMARKFVLNHTKHNIEIFNETELLINISRHTLVPTHQILTSEEKRTLLDRYTLKETQLPRIQKSDAMARYLGLVRGQIVKIIRPSETAGRYVTYRYVI
ncbi:hypothetical protein SUGI_0502210 [Cryptomeria japonica]|uniref:DNA-directed RNA polymerases II and IV subunit 5A n=1 Tax=Cryptomeria japonica TaxID=3369 RepID=UPI0024089D9B|nr:DNA-directed RNA polymerases II and IV subunit 5A [Cryptomeria japonica]GLJ26181.1 hypothetical protein SUGI_0502210 [Cryptomeria japonica]